MSAETEGVHAFAQTLAQVKRNRIKSELSCFDLGKIENVVDDREQGFGGEADETQAVALLGGEFGVQHQLGHAENAVHGRANFMTHGREENALGFTGGFRGLLRGLQLLYCIAALRNIAEAPDAPGTFPIQALSVRAPLTEPTLV